ncbi:MAG: c-type cytochrome biogenesis protein CcsB [Phycicoccus sp.]|nr:c-type cytochrome biogenesis protein CcsB [Phycicoccus sp.]NMM35739.1 c-type cytochrome biogenesis protein CcsB [Phycicoccus sp.]
MTNETLSQYANLGVYSAMAVLTIAMIAFAIDLAGTAPKMSSDRPRKAAGVAMMLTRLGGLLLVAAAALRGLSVHRPPLGNMFEFALVGCMFVIVVFVAISLRRDLRWLGLFVIGPVLLTLGLAITVFYTDASELLPSLKSVWLVIHVTVATFSVALFTIAFSVTILHLVQTWLEAQEPEGMSRLRTTVTTALPPARSLDRTAYGLHVVAFPLWTFTLIAGAIWAEQAWGHYWNWDPKEVWTFVIWVVYAAYLHARATTGWTPRAANYLALAGYGCILVNYMVVNVYFVGQHSYSGM